MVEMGLVACRHRAVDAVNFIVVDLRERPSKMS
jgi:hypothetical protein